MLHNLSHETTASSQSVPLQCGDPNFLPAQRPISYVPLTLSQLVLWLSPVDLAGSHQESFWKARLSLPTPRCDEVWVTGVPLATEGEGYGSRSPDLYLHKIHVELFFLESDTSLA